MKSALQEINARRFTSTVVEMTMNLLLITACFNRLKLSEADRRDSKTTSRHILSVVEMVGEGNGTVVDYIILSCIR